MKLNHLRKDPAILDRRKFLAQTALATSGVLASSCLYGDEIFDDVKITKVVGFDLKTTRPKYVGSNSHGGDKGLHDRDPMVRIFTNQGVEGIGRCAASRERVSQLIGKRLSDFIDPKLVSIKSPLGTQSMALWDLLGKLKGKPVYELLGRQVVRNSVPVYDGSIYLTDLVDKYKNSWSDQFKKEIDLGREWGHTKFKVKVGRGKRLMPQSDGDARDAQVIRLLSEYGGDDIGFGIDANDGYDLSRTKQLMEQVGDCNLLFTEEMFPEAIDECLELKEYFTKNGLKTLVADGETKANWQEFKPFVEAKVVDILQGDMNAFGIEGILAEADLALPQGIQIAPHNWGSLLGFYLQLHIGCVTDNFYLAEQDLLSSPLLIADGYKIENGRCTVPSTPGFGLTLDESKWRDTISTSYEFAI